MRTLRQTLVLTVLALLAPGARAQDPSLCGTWHWEVGGNWSETLTVHADGAYERLVSYGDGSESLAQEGTWQWSAELAAGVIILDGYQERTPTGQYVEIAKRFYLHEPPPYGDVLVVSESFPAQMGELRRLTRLGEAPALAATPAAAVPGQPLPPALVAGVLGLVALVAVAGTFAALALLAMALLALTGVLLLLMLAGAAALGASRR